MYTSSIIILLYPDDDDRRTTTVRSNDTLGNTSLIYTLYWVYQVLILQAHLCIILQALYSYMYSLG